MLAVDAERQQVTVQAGARIKDVVEALRPHGLTLQNYASIAEQQVGCAWAKVCVPRRATSRRATSRRATSRRATSRHATSRRATSLC